MRSGDIFDGEWKTLYDDGTRELSVVEHDDSGEALLLNMDDAHEGLIVQAVYVNGELHGVGKSWWLPDSETWTANHLQAATRNDRVPHIKTPYSFEGEWEHDEKVAGESPPFSSREAPVNLLVHRRDDLQERQHDELAPPRQAARAPSGGERARREAKHFRRQPHKGSGHRRRCGRRARDAEAEDRGGEQAQEGPASAEGIRRTRKKAGPGSWGFFSSRSSCGGGRPCRR
eukprot:COSAG04_NODE_355_length_16048_cov_133.443511_2_plen_230_part_00